MKKTFIFLITLLVFNSCNRDNSNPTPASGSYLKFKANGQQIQMNGSLSAITSSGEGVYVNKIISSNMHNFLAQKGSNNLIIFSIMVDSLKTQQYTNSQMTLVSSIVSGTQYYLGVSGSNSLQVTITRHSNGTLDGTFTGRMEAISNPASILTITEGEFKNVQVVY